jgi:NADPH:quinone reductase-like Zn-dependent oxidoreductase
LLHAVGSGVGTAALQLCAAAGARVIGTSRTEDKLERCKELGPFEGIASGDKRFAARVLELTGQRGVDAILDSVGAAYLAENLAALAPRGRLVIIGLMGGATGEIPLGPLLAKRLRILGTVLRSRPLEEKAALAQAFAQHVVPLFASGRLRPVVDRVMPMRDVAAAHAYLESNQSFGKVVLSWE